MLRVCTSSIIVKLSIGGVSSILADVRFGSFSQNLVTYIIDWLMNPRIPNHKVVIVVCASIISESEVSITILCLLCSPCYTAVRIKNCSKSTSVITVATMKNTMVLHAPVIVWNWSIHCPTLSVVFDSLHSSTNQELFESISVIKVTTMKSTDDFSLHKGSQHAQPPN